MTFDPAPRLQLEEPHDRLTHQAVDTLLLGRFLVSRLE